MWNNKYLGGRKDRSGTYGTRPRNVCFFAADQHEHMARSLIIHEQLCTCAEVLPGKTSMADMSSKTVF